ncbi:MAG: XRE family transcriptional regulator [Promicromonosporaceae bacterium]|nr:XRE family transcriptional regulator [Promicromonosporaceae bacterium]
MPETSQGVATLDEFDFPTWLRERRRALGLTQAEAASRLGLARPNYVAMERGTRVPQPKTERALRERLSARPSELVRRNRQAARAAISAQGFVNPRLFGSSAHDADGSDSDIDLLVTPGPDRQRTSLLDVVRLQDTLARLLTIPVDVVVDRGRHNLAFDAIRATAVPL